MLALLLPLPLLGLARLRALLPTLEPELEPAAAPMVGQGRTLAQAPLEPRNPKPRLRVVIKIELVVLTDESGSTGQLCLPTTEPPEALRPTMSLILLPTQRIAEPELPPALKSG